MHMKDVNISFLHETVWVLTKWIVHVEDREELRTQLE